MSATAQTRIFGIRVGADPKIIAGALIALAVFLFWFNSRSGDDGAGPTAAVRHQAAVTQAPLHNSLATNPRRQTNVNDSGALRLRPVDASRGDIDPTLRLDLLARLRSVQAGGGGRSLFESGPAPLTVQEQRLIAHPPVVPKHDPAPLPPSPTQPIITEPVVNIPLKYYGFVRSGPSTEGPHGLFLDGDNVVVASEGDLVLKRYLVVALSPNFARLEDTQIKKGQSLPVTPAATP